MNAKGANDHPPVPISSFIPLHSSFASKIACRGNPVRFVGLVTIPNEIAKRRTFAIISHPDAGKTTLTAALCRRMRDHYSVGAITNDSYTQEDAEALMRMQALPQDRYGDDEVALAALPFFHIYGMQVLMNGLLANGVTAVSLPRFDMVEALTAGAA